MKVKEPKEIQGIDGTPAPADRGVRPRTDRVSVEEAQRAADAAAAGRVKAGVDRTARLKQLEAAIKSGQYHPNASQIADELLDAAELDARLRAIFEK